MTVSAKLDELHSRQTAESWADGAESGQEPRLPHNSGYFNAGLRIYDLSDPVRPFEVAHYIPADPEKRLGMLPKTLVTQSEDVLVDRRGYIYMTDKNHGLHILRCTV